MHRGSKTITNPPHHHHRPPRLLELLRDWFNPVLGEKLLDHLKHWLDPESLIKGGPFAWKSGEPSSLPSHCITIGLAASNPCIREGQWCR
jgi:hypothetical protein